MYFIVKNNKYLSKIQRKCLMEALENDLEISFDDASYDIDDHDTKIIIHEGDECEVV